MNSIETITSRMELRGAQPAVFWRSDWYSYDQLLGMISEWRERLSTLRIGSGTVCAVVSDYSPQTAALFFALMLDGVIVVPMLRGSEKRGGDILAIAGVQVIILVDDADNWVVEHRVGMPRNALVQEFRKQKSPGLIVFTSGSTGVPKGILHDVERVGRKFVAERPGWRTVLFLMMDHFGGFNSLLSSFAYGGAAVCLPSRNPDDVCAAIGRSGATLLPTTPTFLNLLVASGSHRRHDVTSIRLITYGTEVMNQETLRRVREAFPNAAVKQTYGLSELGVLRSRSESDDSVWVRLGGDGFEVKVVDDVLWIRSEANMVGYLNAPNPFDEQGWMCTEDRVEMKGDYFRILGRESDLIFVGGEKVFPAEVEAVLLQDGNVREAAVYGVKHALTGQIVQATIALVHPEPSSTLTPRLRRLCLEKLARFKVPVRFIIAERDELHSERFKKIRPATAGGP